MTEQENIEFRVIKSFDGESVVDALKKYKHEDVSIEKTINDVMRAMQVEIHIHDQVIVR